MKDDVTLFQAILDSGSPQAEAIKRMVKEQYVLSKHKNKIQQWIETKNGKTYEGYATRPNGQKKYVRCKTYDGLIDKLYDYYMGEALTLSDVWVAAKENAAGIKTTTLVRYQSSWDKYFDKYPISGMALKSLSLEDWNSHFVKIVSQNEMTKKQVSNARDVVSMIYKHAIRCKIVQHNPTKDILFADLPVKKTAAYNSVKVKPFTAEEAKKLSEWCISQAAKSKSPSYYWAIVFNLVMGLRVGELSALKWSDIDVTNQKMTVRRQRLKDYDYDNGELSCIGYVEAGNLKGFEAPRVLPMPEDVVYALEQIRALNLDKELVFPVFRYRTYNEKIKQGAQAIGLVGTEYRTHSLRATAATMLYLQTKDVYAVQLLLGHTNVEMTMKYIKDIQKTDNLRASMLADYSFPLSCRFVPQKNTDFGHEKTPETLILKDFRGLTKGWSIGGSNPYAKKIKAEKR